MNIDVQNSSRYWLFWLILAAIAVLLPPYVWHENTSGFLTDDGMYLLLADYFSPYYEGNYLTERFVMERSRFPPLFPMLVGLLGGGSEHMQVAHLVTGGTFILSAVLFYAWSRHILGTRDLAAACMLIYALLPKTLVYVTEIWSEFLYTALVFAALLMLCRVGSRHPRSQEILSACALFAGLSLLTRTIGVTLLAAFVLYLFLNGVKRKYFYILIAVSLPACWQLIKMVNGYGGGYMEDLAPYLTPDGIFKLLLTDIPHNASVLRQSWNTHFSVSSASHGSAQVATALLLILALIGAARRAIDKRIDSHYFIIYIAVLLVWPHPGHLTRLLYPVMPLALVYIFTGLGGVAAAGGALTRARYLSHAGLALLLLAMIYPTTLFVVNHFLAPVPQHIPEDYRHTGPYLIGGNTQTVYREAERKDVIVRLLRRIDDHLAPHECVYAVHPVTATLYSHRRAVLLPAEASMNKLGICEYLFVMNLAGKFDAGYPLNRIEQGRLSILDLERDTRGEAQAFLFRIER